MKVKYKGKALSNYYGFDLMTGGTYDFPSTLRLKVVNHPDFEIDDGDSNGNKEPSVKKARRTARRKVTNNTRSD